MSPNTLPKVIWVGDIAPTRHLCVTQTPPYTRARGKGSLRGHKNTAQVAVGPLRLHPFGSPAGHLHVMRASCGCARHVGEPDAARSCAIRAYVRCALCAHDRRVVCRSGSLTRTHACDAHTCRASTHVGCAQRTSTVRGSLTRE